MKPVLFAFALSLAMSAQEAAKPQMESAPIKFRGAYLGQPLSDYASCSGEKATPLLKGYRTHGHLCKGGRGYVYHTKAVGTWSPKMSGEILHFENLQLVRIAIYVPEAEWDKVRYDLTEKLGPPLKEPPQVFGNAVGGKWEFNQGFWRKGDLVVYAGDKVRTRGGCAGLSDLFTDGMNRPCSEGIEITITTAERAATPDKTPSVLD